MRERKTRGSYRLFFKIAKAVGLLLMTHSEEDSCKLRRRDQQQPLRHFLLAHEENDDPPSPENKVLEEGLRQNRLRVKHRHAPLLESKSLNPEEQDYPYSWTRSTS
ncbi:MAG: hypothetical protein GY820_42690 [Gammaproteobacteria bacterium]|nr:hypothetical protein [Gammaproteobacteria bacterium]